MNQDFSLTEARSHREINSAFSPWLRASVRDYSFSGLNKWRAATPGWRRQDAASPKK